MGHEIVTDMDHNFSRKVFLSSDCFFCALMPSIKMTRFCNSDYSIQIEEAVSRMHAIASSAV